MDTISEDRDDTPLVECKVSPNLANFDFRMLYLIGIPSMEKGDSSWTLLVRKFVSRPLLVFRRRHVIIP